MAIPPLKPEYVRKDYEKQIPVKTLLLNEIYEGGLFGCGTLWQWGCWIGGGGDFSTVLSKWEGQLDNTKTK